MEDTNKLENLCSKTNELLNRFRAKWFRMFQNKLVDKMQYFFIEEIHERKK